MVKQSRPIDGIDNAIKEFKERLKEDPGDGGGVRYHLVPCLYEKEKYEELEQLLEEFKDDPSSWLVLTRAVYYFKTGNEKCDQALTHALTENPYVYPFLAGFVPLPDELPTRMEVCSEAEAAAYVKEYGYQWENTAGALDWMNAVVAKSITDLMSDPDQQITIEQLIGQVGPGGTASDGAGCCDHMLMSLEGLIPQERGKGKSGEHSCDEDDNWISDVQSPFIVS